MNKLELVIMESGVEESTALTLKNSFTPFLIKANEWAEKAKELVVTDISQTREMKMAREARLALKDVRVAADKKRKELKEDSIRYGKAVQFAYNTIEGLITPIEEHLQQQEDFAKIAEAKRKAKLKAQREEELKEYGDYVPLGIDFGDLTDNAYQTMVAGIKAQIQAKIDAERKAEEERIEAQRKADLRLERLGILRPFWNFMDDAEKQWDYAEISDEDFENFTAKLNDMVIEHKANQERIRIENERLKAEAAEKERLLNIEREAAKEAARKEREAAELILETERKIAKDAAEKAALEKAALEAEIKAKRDAEIKAEQEAKAAEKARLLAEKKAKAAPDKEKLIAFANSLLVIQSVELVSDEAKSVLYEAKKLISGARTFILNYAESL
jgi:hypothetical protein